MFAKNCPENVFPGQRIWQIHLDGDCKPAPTGEVEMGLEPCSHRLSSRTHVLDSQIIASAEVLPRLDLR